MVGSALSSHRPSWAIKQKPPASSNHTEMSDPLNFTNFSPYCKIRAREEGLQTVFSAPSLPGLPLDRRVSWIRGYACRESTPVNFFRSSSNCLDLKDFRVSSNTAMASTITSFSFRSWGHATKGQLSRRPLNSRSSVAAARRRWWSSTFRRSSIALESRIFFAVIGRQPLLFFPFRPAWGHEGRLSFVAFPFDVKLEMTNNIKQY